MTTQPVPSITDEQIAEIEAVAERANARGLRSGLIVHQGVLLDLISRLRAAERDAARYRALRDQSRRPIVVRDQHSHLFGGLLDSRIDTAMKGEQQ